jgi:hypothetical protein
MPVAKEQGATAQPPKGWSEVQEGQRLTRYWLDQADAAGARLARVLQVLRENLLFERPG